MKRQPRVTIRARFGSRQFEVQGPQDWADKEHRLFERRERNRILREQKGQEGG